MKVVAIAPYNGLRELILQLGKNEKDIDLQVELGDLTQGVDIAKKAEKMGTDIIISRGGTAELIQKEVSIPVIDIEVSGYDMMRVLTLASNFQGKAAIVGFPAIAEGAQSICSLLDINIPTYVVHNQSEVVPKLQAIKKEDYQVIIGDVITVQEAEKLGFSTVLFTSGKESVVKSFNEARKIHNILMNVKKEQMIPTTIIQRVKEGVVVLDKDSNILYTNQYLNNQFDNKFVVDEEWVKVVLNKGEFNTITEINNSIWKISGHQMKELDITYIVFRVCKVFDSSKKKVQGVFIKKTNIGTNSNGLMYLSVQSGCMKDMLEKVNAYEETKSPIWIFGENGTEKDDLAEFIHFRSHMKSCPFITIDCDLVLENEWEDLFGIDTWRENLFTDVDEATIYFKDIHRLSTANQKILTQFIRSNDNQSLRFITSSLDNVNMHVKIDHFSEELYYLLGHLTLEIPSLRSRLEELDSLATLFISEFNTFHGRQVVGIRKEALLKLKSYMWPGNTIQFKNVIEELVVLCKNDYIELNDVEQVLSKKISKENVEVDVIELKGTLEEIEKNIIQKILEKEDMNQSQAARRLGISRSTLWRKLQ